MRIADEHGSAVGLTLVILMVLIVLAGSYVAITATEMRQSVRQSDLIQAYYYARSGVEVGLEWVDANIEAFKGEEENEDGAITKRLYGCMDTGTFSDTEPVDAGDVDVIISLTTTGLTYMIEIEAVGRFGMGTAEANSALRLEQSLTEDEPGEPQYTDWVLPIEEAFPDSPDDPHSGFSEATCASDVDWVSGNSGNMESGDFTQNGAIRFTPPANPANSLRLNKGNAHFQADTIFLGSEDNTKPLNIHANRTLNITASVTILGAEVELKTDEDGSGRLCLHAPESGSNIVYFHRGVVDDNNPEHVFIEPETAFKIPAGKKMCIPGLAATGPILPPPKQWETWIWY